MESCEIQFEELIDFADDRLDSARAEEIRSHVEAGCTHCQSAISWIRETSGHISESDEFLTPPALEFAKALALFRLRNAAAGIRTLVAELTFDSQRSAILSAARDSPLLDVVAPNPPVVRRLFNCAPFQIDVSQERISGDLFYIIAQVLATSNSAIVEPISATLFPRVGTPVTASIENGELHFDAVRNGPYRIQIDAADTLIILPEVNE